MGTGRVTRPRQLISAALVTVLAGITGASAAPDQPLREVFSTSLGDSGFYAVDEDAGSACGVTAVERRLPSSTVRVLVVEDERSLADAIGRGLRRQGMAVDVAYDGTNGHELALVTRYDVVVLDRDLPGVRGDKICADLVASGALTRVLMLTASGSVADRVEGLQLGADDYLPKPFAFDELVARVQALGRRATPATPPVLAVADLVLDQAKRIVTRAGMLIDLTRKEFGVLEELLKARGAVVSSEELLERVWDANADPFTTTVRVTVMTLRKKLGDPPLIETVVGAGYRVPAA